MKHDLSLGSGFVVQPAATGEMEDAVIFGSPLLRVQEKKNLLQNFLLGPSYNNRLTPGKKARLVQHLQNDLPYSSRRFQGTVTGGLSNVLCQI